MWPEPSKSNYEGFKQFKDKWGFACMFIIPQDSIGWASNVQQVAAMKAGYEPKDMMVDMWDTNCPWVIENIPASYYYLGECVEHDCYGHPSNGGVTHIYPPSELAPLKEQVRVQRPGSSFVIDGYKRCSHLNIAVQNADQVMYSGYCNWNSVGLPVCRPNIGWGDTWEAPYVQGNDFQGDSWQDMKNKYGAKFRMSWMRGGGDEYHDLFMTANRLGLEVVWLYGYDGASEQNISAFCEAAYYNGWLNRVDSTIIPTPANLVASATIPGEISLTWQKNYSLVEKGYIIERKQAPFDYFVVINTLTDKSVTFIDNSVSESSAYTYRVRGYNDFTVSDYSNEITVVSLPLPRPALAFPPDLFLNHATSIQFSWNNVPSVQYYHLQYSTDRLFNAGLYQDSLITDTLAKSGLLEYGKTYFWRIGARFQTGHTYWSGVRQFDNIFVPLSYKVSGDVSYINNSQGYPVDSVLVVLKDKNSEKIFTALSGADGRYVINDVLPGTYIITASKNGHWSNVNSADALLIAKFFSNLISFNNLQVCAADFNNNGAVNTTDALMVMNKFVGIISDLPGNKPEWVFAKENNLYNVTSSSQEPVCAEETIQVLSSDLNIKLKALCSGDVNYIKDK